MPAPYTDTNLVCCSDLKVRLWSVCTLPAITYSLLEELRLVDTNCVCCLYLKVRRCSEYSFHWYSFLPVWGCQVTPTPSDSDTNSKWPWHQLQVTLTRLPRMCDVHVGVGSPKADSVGCKYTCVMVIGAMLMDLTPWLHPKWDAVL